MTRSQTLRVAKIIWPLLLLAAAVVFPLESNAAVQIVAFYALLAATAAAAWNIFSGYTGYVSLGHGAFFAFGAYAMALVTRDLHLPGGFTPFLVVPVAGVAAALVAFPFGWIALRRRGHAFVVMTLIIFFIFQMLALNLRGITQGTTGLDMPPLGFGVDWALLPFYYIELAILVLTLLVSWYIRNSRYGLWLLAIRDDEDRAEGLGVRAGFSKLVALVISAFFTGMVGAMLAYSIFTIYPSTAFDPAWTINIVLMAYLGGAGTLSGPVLGAIILEAAQQYFGLNAQTGYYQITLGALFLFVMLVMPQGIVRSAVKLWNAWRVRRGAGGTPVAPERQPVMVERG